MRKAKRIMIGENKELLAKFKKSALEVYENRGIDNFFYFLKGLQKVMFKKAPPYELEDLTPKERLDMCIEFYMLLFYCYHGKPERYTSDTEDEMFQFMGDDVLFHRLLDEKMEKYGKEIFKDIGLELLGKDENGYLVIDLNGGAGKIQ